MNFSIPQIIEICKAEPIKGQSEDMVRSVFVDSRFPDFAIGSMFVAIKGRNSDGHDFCKQLSESGIRYFLVERKLPLPEECIQFVVQNTIQALQSLAAAHRSKFLGKVLAITGSNGKTMVKEWIGEVLSGSVSFYKSPKSYNSQIGVPLSVLKAPVDKELYIFEAGISLRGEMEKLYRILKPNYGVFTHLGSVHSEGFESLQHKLEEKLKLFYGCEWVLLGKEMLLYQNALSFLSKYSVSTKVITWSFSNPDSDFLVKHEKSIFNIQNEKWNISLKVPYSDSISLSNLSMSAIVSYLVGGNETSILSKLAHLPSLSLRLELIEGVNNCTIVNDTWTNDPDTLSASIDFLLLHKKNQESILILSDFAGTYSEEVYENTIHLLLNKGIKQVFFIGSIWSNYLKSNPSFLYTCFKDTQEFLNSRLGFQNKAILLKGSRKFEMEKIAYAFQHKFHQTQLEINLDNLAYNFSLLKTNLRPNTKVMAMVKAFAYGAGNFEVAKHLQFLGADALAVAFADEGIALRKAGITLPIMVLNFEPSQLQPYIQFNLQPSIGSKRQLDSLPNDISLHIHIELDTGMHRLGFMSEDIEYLVFSLMEKKNLKIEGIYTHLASAENVLDDRQSEKQIRTFFEIADKISSVLNYKPTYHISNSAAAIRFKELNSDMVRLGISLYGINPVTSKSISLKPVFRLKTFISQIKTIPKNEGIGYGFEDVSETSRQIAILPLGYADGFNRKFGMGKNSVYINGKRAKTLGRICMDMCMVDVSDISCQEGDEVVLFENANQIQEWADIAETIPYEILTSLSQRIKRVFVSEV